MGRSTGHAEPAKYSAGSIVATGLIVAKGDRRRAHPRTFRAKAAKKSSLLPDDGVYADRSIRFRPKPVTALFLGTPPQLLEYHAVWKTARIQTAVSSEFGRDYAAFLVWHKFATRTLGGSLSVSRLAFAARQIAFD